MLLFLGAGASVPFGVPTTKGFVEIFDEEVGQNELYATIKQGMGEEAVDLESILTILDDLSKPKSEIIKAISPHTFEFLLKNMTKIDSYLEDQQIKNVAQELLLSLKAIITKQCIIGVRESTGRILEVYDALFSCLTKVMGHSTNTGDGKVKMPRARIFTTNYDTCVERYFNEHETELVTGIVPQHGEDVFALYSYRNVPDAQAQLVKLHGSIDLFREGGSIKQRKMFAPPAQGLTNLGRRRGNPLLVYPIESSGYRHVLQSPFLDLFRLLRDCLDTESSWIIIGSSLRDLTISSTMNSVMAEKKRTSEYPRVVLMDPEAEAIIGKVKNDGFEILASKMKPMPIKFGEGTFADDLVALLQSSKD